MYLALMRLKRFVLVRQILDRRKFTNLECGKSLVSGSSNSSNMALSAASAMAASLWAVNTKSFFYRLESWLINLSWDLAASALALCQSGWKSLRRMN